MSLRQLLPPIFILLSVVTALCGVALATRAGRSPTVVLDVYWTAASLWAAVACLRRAGKSRDTDYRRAWRLFGMGCASWFAGQMLWNFQEFTTGHTPAFAGWQDAAYAGVGPFFLAGIYFLSGKNTSSMGTVRKLCNLTILCCSTTIILLPLFSKLILKSEAPLSFLLAILGGGVLLPTAFLGGLLNLWLYTPARAVWPASLLVSGIGVVTAATIQYSLESAGGAYQPGNLGDYLYLAGFGLMIWATQVSCTEGYLPQTGPHKAPRIAYLEPAMTTICMLAVLAAVLWMRDEFSSLLSYTVPLFGLLAISVGIRDAWSAYIEDRLFRKLRESESLFRQVVDSNMNGIVFADQSGTITDANNAFLKIIGCSREELEKGLLNVPQLTPPEFAPREKDAKEELEEQGACRPYEKKLLRKDGVRVPVLVSRVSQRRADGHIRGWISTVTDLSELKAAQGALESNERRFRALVEHASDYIAAWDAEGIVRYATPSNSRLVGYSMEEIVGRPVRDFFHPDDVPAMDEMRNIAMQNRRAQVPVKARVRHKDGSWRFCEGVLTNLLDDPAVGALVVNYHDITERQRTEDALHESKALLRAFMDNSPTHMFIKDRQGRYLHVNKRWLDAIGTTPEAVLGRTDWEIFPPEHAQTYTDSDERTFAAGEPMQFEETISDHAGEHFSIVQKFPLRDAEGNITALGGVGTDITERVRAEQSLRLSEERYRHLVEGARDAIFTLSPDGILTSANPGAELITGVPNRERVGKPFLPIVAQDDAPKALETFKSVLAGRRVETVEFMIYGAGGRQVLMEFTATPQYHGDKIIGVLGIGRDITERRALEQQLRHSQKMESVGQLAGGVAHDFNNLLTVIQGNASLIECEEGLPPSVTGCVQQISAASERAATLTRQLLAFSRRQLIQPRNLDVNKIIGDLAKMLRRLLGEDIRLQFESSSNLPLVHADAGMLEQVLLNLAVNARDAMPLGGWLTINTSKVDVSEADVRTNPEARPGSFVRISVADTGQGIAPEHLPHVFEPFFTTKDVGKGTGLGLATVYGIVKQHQGWVDIHSTVDEGTRLDIYIPANAPSMEPAPQSPAAADAMPRGHETILVVEDEAPLRSMVKLILSRLGYHVIEAASGVEAQVLWSQYRDSVELVFTDIVMPDGVSGQQLVEQLQKDRPDLRVLYTSGYSAQMLASNGRLPDGAYCLQKPYMPPALASAVREALNGSPMPATAG